MYYIVDLTTDKRIKMNFGSDDSARSYIGDWLPDETPYGVFEVETNDCRLIVYAGQEGRPW